MCRKATFRGGWGTILTLLAALWAVPAVAQQEGGGGGLRPDWRRIGNSAVEIFLASPATGPVDRVWFSEDGSRLFAQTSAGLVFLTRDFERWEPAKAAPAPPDPAPVPAPLPEPGARALTHPADRTRLYALGRSVYSSDDGGRSWANRTLYRGESIIGGGMRDIALAPGDPDQLVVANEHGLWRSLDGGASWTGLNLGLPALPARRLAGTPSGSRGTRVVVDGLGVAEWMPGEKHAWRPVGDPGLAADEALRRSASVRIGADVSVLAASGRYAYAGSSTGAIWVSVDEGQTWRLSREPDSSPVVGLYVPPEEPYFALALLGPSAGAGAARVLHSANGGLVWDDITSNLPEADPHALTADLPSGAVYVAGGGGLYLAYTDLSARGPAPEWVRIGGRLPDAPVMDVKLDAGANQLYVAVEGYGVYAAMAPHRVRFPRVVNAADFSSRAAAPGSVLSVLGRQVGQARVGSVAAPVLAALPEESQIQVPFEATGSSVTLALETGPSGWLTMGVPLQSVSPALFIDRDGAPLLVDADSGLLLDAMTPARSNGRVQILATGLGRVRPDWPTGRAAPAEDPPQVVARVRAYLDREPLEVTSATLAPGYVGFYLVEVRLPEIVNRGPAELYIEAGGRESNRVRLYLEP